MAIRVNLETAMEKRRVGLTELSDKSGVSLRNLTILRENRAKAIRMTTLEAICRGAGIASREIYWNLRTINGNSRESTRFLGISSLLFY